MNPATTASPKFKRSLAPTADQLAYVGEVSREIGWVAHVIAIQQAGEVMLPAARSFWRHPRFVELEARREPHPERPCPARCGHCASCVCADAWQRRGGRPYLGVRREAELAAGAR